MMTPRCAPQKIGSTVLDEFAKILKMSRNEMAKFRFHAKHVLPWESDNVSEELQGFADVIKKTAETTSI